jgi:hypothetical protein
MTIKKQPDLINLVLKNEHLELKYYNFSMRIYFNPINASFRHATI